LGAGNTQSSISMCLETPSDKLPTIIAFYKTHPLANRPS